jgi:farnesyl diphosphate synthase
LDNYLKIVIYKTSHYTFFLPVAASLILFGLQKDSALMGRCKTIAEEIGIKFQIQDDILDCYGLPEMIGKVGTDIQDHKCSWLIIKAMELMDRVSDNHPGRAIILEHYGHEAPSSVAAIKSLYESLHVKDAFDQYEENSFTNIKHLIQNSDPIFSCLFLPILNKIHRRQK